MYDFVTAKRSDDAVISISQHNQKKTILIDDMNKIAENLLGYTAQELAFCPLTSILEKDICEYITEHIEYNTEGVDLFDLLLKVRNILLINKRGNILHAHVKIFRTSSENHDKINYELLIRDCSISHKLNILRRQILGNISYTIHKDFGILDSISTLLECDVVMKFLNQYKIDGVACLIAADYPGKCQVKEITSEINDIIHKNIRYSDIAGYVESNKILIILIKCKIIDASSVVNRIHNRLRHGLKEDRATVSIAYTSMLENRNSADMIDNLIFSLDELQKEGGNSAKLATYLERDR